MQLVNTYAHLVSAIGVLSLVLLVQLLAADVIGIVSKHNPGTPVVADHGSLLFRASRVVGNSNESIAIFILASAFCVLVNASAFSVGVCAWAFVTSRVLYAVCYYANWQTMRSVVFGLSLLSLLALIITGAVAWR